MKTPEFTLTAGPTMASHRVLAALGEPILFDYDPVFLDLFRDTERLLAIGVPDDERRRAHAGRGRPRAGGRRARTGPRRNPVPQPRLRRVRRVVRRLAARLRRRLHEVRVPYDEAIDPDAVAAALRDHGPFEFVALVHSETPSGIENPLAQIAPLVH